MSETWNEELGERLGERLGKPVEIEHASLVLGSTSKEVWAVDAGTPEGELELLVLRPTGGEDEGRPDKGLLREAGREPARLGGGQCRGDGEAR